MDGLLPLESALSLVNVLRIYQALSCIHVSVNFSRQCKRLLSENRDWKRMLYYVNRFHVDKSTISELRSVANDQQSLQLGYDDEVSYVMEHSTYSYRSTSCMCNITKFLIQHISSALPHASTVTT